MSRTALIGMLVLAAAASPIGAGEPAPHLDRSVVAEGCRACHAGHGASDSPMLPASQRDICLSCHGVGFDGAKVAVSVAARPKRLPVEKSFTHPIDGAGFSRHDGGVVCTSCHAPHRAVERSVRIAGGRRSSPRDPARFEHELCLECHGELDGSAVSVGRFIGGRIRPGNRSSHPIEAPSPDRSPSIDPRLAGREIDCGDCHGNDDPNGAAGPHGSSVPKILRAPYVTADGQPESPQAYALCYGCHDRESILRGESFPLHGKHVVELRVSCSTCHDAHGSIANRALIRFDDRAGAASVGPSQTSGLLAFESDAPGTGLCHLSCHGYDHGPEGYGAQALLLGPNDERLRIPTQLPARRRGVRRPDLGPH